MPENGLERNKTDLLTSAAKSVLGALPYGGPLLSELIGNLIPDQRIDRLAKYIIELGRVDICGIICICPHLPYPIVNGQK